jgi:hypothetical protein
MPTILLWLSRKSSRYVFGLAWAVILIDLLFNLVPHLRLTRFAAALFGLAVMFGYPFIIVFGFPRPYSSQKSRVTSVLALLVLIGVCVASMVDPTAIPPAPTSWIGTLVGIPLIALIFSPFFVATHVLAEARRELRVYKPLDSIGAWISLFYFAFGGVFFLHPKVSSTAESIANMREPIEGTTDIGAI